MAAPRRRDLVEILDDHERNIRRLSQTIARTGNVDLALYLPLTGGTMTGIIENDNGTGWNPVAWTRDITGTDWKSEVGTSTTGEWIARVLNDSDVEQTRFTLSKSSTEQSVISTTLKIDNPVAYGGTDDAQIRLTKTGDGNSVLLRNDGSSFYFLSTDTEDGTWNSNRPFSFDLTNGYVTLGQIVGDILMRNNRLYFNYQTETDSYIEHDTSSNIYRYFNAGNEMMRMGEGILSLYGGSWGQVSSLEAGSMYVTAEVANNDLYLRTDNGGGAKARIWIDGSANTIRFYNHDGTAVWEMTADQLRSYSDGSSTNPTFSWQNQTNSGMYWVESTKRIYFTNQGTAAIVMTTGGIYPAVSNVQQVGNSTLDWKDVWAIDTSINSSDETLKKQMKGIDLDVANAFIRNIEPIRFKWKDGGSRFHWGYGARQFAASLIEAGLDPADYGAYIDPTKDRIGDDDEGDGFLASPEEKANPRRNSLRLRPLEVVPVVIRWAQGADQRIAELERRIAELEAA